MARDRTFKIITYVFAGLSMMLNIRLVYSASPYALLRFKLPENLFSIFVRRMATSLELWCLPSMLLGNIIDQFDKQVIGVTHSERIYSDAPKYDVGGDGLMDKLEALMEKAQTLYDAANTLASDTALGLQSQAGGLRDAAKGSNDKLYEKADALAKTPNDGNADQVITAFEAVRTKYNELTSNGNYNTHKENAKVKAVDKAYGDLEKVYNTMLNVKKANLLKEQVGDGQDTKIWKKAKDLHDKANLLASADKLSSRDDLKKLAQDLATAVGASELVDGLQKALKELSSATDSDKADLVKKAEEVINKYNAVVDAYNAVKAQETQYTTALGGSGQEYNNVTSDFGALEGAYKLANCKVIKLIFDKEMIRYCSIICTWSNFLTFVILFFVFITGGDTGHVTTFYWVIAASGFVFGIYMVFVYAMEIDFITWYIAGENSFPIITSFMHYVSISLFGNRRKWNTDYIAVNVDMTVSMIIAFVAAALWTYCYINPSTHEYWPPSTIKLHVISPALMIIVGMGLVYMIYPAIAPGMIVPFYLVDKIEMVLLVMTTFPPVLFASLREHYGFKSPESPICNWGTENTLYPGAPDKGPGWYWHFFDILMPLKISLAIVFLYSLHYRGSSISRSIINQPKMSTTLSIIFYMCHEILLATGFPGMVGNDGAGDNLMLPIQYIGALFMIFGAMYSEGYITEYKRHEPSHWPTEGMTKWNAFCYWCKMASKNFNYNLIHLFTKDLRKDLLLCIRTGDLI